MRAVTWTFLKRAALTHSEASPEHPGEQEEAQLWLLRDAVQWKRHIHEAASLQEPLLGIGNEKKMYFLLD